MVSEAAYRAARTRVASIDRSARGRVFVSGADRASYLQGLLTNDIAALGPGSGCYAAYLTPQGRMISDVYVYEVGDEILLALPRHVKDSVLGKLDRFIFTEDVTVRDATDAWDETAIVGPNAAEVMSRVLEGLSLDRIRALPEHGNLRVDFGGSRAVVTRVVDTGEPGFEIYVERPDTAALRSRLAAAGVLSLDLETADALRIEAGVPLFGRDMDEDTIPLEAGIEDRAISFTKGCYVGQEVIVRVLHRGHGRVARRLVGLRIDGDRVPAPGAEVRAAEREVGRITSSTTSPALKALIALAYVQRDFAAPETVVTVDGSRAVVAALPFVHE
jgi:folate-binding protein YgfZ